MLSILWPLASDKVMNPICEVEALYEILLLSVTTGTAHLQLNFVLKLHINKNVTIIMLECQQLKLLLHTELWDKTHFHIPCSEIMSPLKPFTFLIPNSLGLLNDLNGEMWKIWCMNCSGDQFSLKIHTCCHNTIWHYFHGLSLCLVYTGQVLLSDTKLQTCGLDFQYPWKYLKFITGMS
jgi:hypothetical protein